MLALLSIQKRAEQVSVGDYSLATAASCRYRGGGSWGEPEHSRQHESCSLRHMLAAVW